MDNPKLKVAFLVGSDNYSTNSAIEAVCRLPGVVPAAVLLDTEAASWKRRFKNLSRNIRTNGRSYPAFRILQAVRGRVVVEDVVADFGAHHGAEHAFRRPRDGVAAKVNHCRVPSATR